MSVDQNAGADHVAEWGVFSQIREALRVRACGCVHSRENDYLLLDE